MAVGGDGELAGEWNQKTWLGFDGVTWSPSPTCGFASGSKEPRLGVASGSLSQVLQAFMQGEPGGVHSGLPAPLGLVSPNPGRCPRTFSLLDEKDGNGWAGEMIITGHFCKALTYSFSYMSVPPFY